MKWNDKITGWMGEDELTWLYDKAVGMRSIVEIGSWLGRSTSALCSGCPGIVFAVDHFMGSQEHRGFSELPTLQESFRKNMEAFSNVVVLPMSSLEATKDDRIPQQIDMVFIDGSHQYEDVSLDFRLWRSRAKILFCGHDRGQDGVPKALTELNDEVKSGPGSLWYVEVK